MAKRGVGSSVFTHVDDLGAELHTSDFNHKDAMFYGGDVPKKHELQEVVLGPPAFGSPDPRTLGHTMAPANNERAASAPDLSEDYGAGKPVVGHSVSDDLPEWSKSDKKEDLLKAAQARGLNLTDDNTKPEIVDALEEHDEKLESDENDEDDENEENEETDDDEDDDDETNDENN